MADVVNAPVIDDFVLTDYSGAPITGKTTLDFATAIAYLKSDPETTEDLAITEQGGVLAGTGTYMASFETATADKWGMVVVYNAGGVVRRFTGTFTVITAAQADPAGALAGATIVTGSPVAVTGEVDIYRGDAYASADARQLPWEITDASTIPDLTGATVTLYATHTANKSVSFVASGSVVTPTGSTRNVIVQLTSEQTVALLDGEYAYSVVATPASGRPFTLAADTLTVHSGGRPPRRG